MKAELAKELTVDLAEDRPGQLAKAAEAVGRAKINLDGFAEFDGKMRILTRDTAGARRALEAAGLRVTGETDVVVAYAPDVPGTAGALFRKIAEPGLNVRYAYAATKDRIVIAGSDPQRVLEVVEKA